MKPQCVRASGCQYLQSCPKMMECRQKVLRGQRRVRSLVRMGRTEKAEKVQQLGRRLTMRREI